MVFSLLDSTSYFVMDICLLEKVSSVGLSSCSVKKGGPNPVSNTTLATILDKAKELDVPKDIVERNIKRASEKGQEAFIEKIYEVRS